MSVVTISWSTLNSWQDFLRRSFALSSSTSTVSGRKTLLTFLGHQASFRKS